MEQNKIKLDYQKNTASISLKQDRPFVVVTDQGNAKAFELPDYGELIVKVYDGRVTLVNVSKRHKY